MPSRAVPKRTSRCSAVQKSTVRTSDNWSVTEHVYSRCERVLAGAIRSGRHPSVTTRTHTKLRHRRRSRYRGRRSITSGDLSTNRRGATMSRHNPPTDSTGPHEHDPSSRVLSFECEDDTIVIYDRENSTEWIKSSRSIHLREWR
jgi:hypothetical protein